jgi:hypothetical protein
MRTALLLSAPLFTLFLAAGCSESTVKYIEDDAVELTVPADIGEVEGTQLCVGETSVSAFAIATGRTTDAGTPQYSFAFRAVPDLSDCGTINLDPEAMVEYNGTFDDASVTVVSYDSAGVEIEGEDGSYWEGYTNPNVEVDYYGPTNTDAHIPYYATVVTWLLGVGYDAEEEQEVHLNLGAFAFTIEDECTTPRSGAPDGTEFICDVVPLAVSYSETDR